MIPLSCPRCTGEARLDDTAEGARCPTCGSVYPRANNVVSFAAKQDGVRIDPAHRRKLAAALAAVTGPVVDDALAGAGLDPDLEGLSPDWRYYLRLDDDQRVLLLGPQIGDLASRLAGLAGGLVAACPVAEAAALAARRSQGLDRPFAVVHVEGVPALPFAAESFDMAILLRPLRNMVGTDKGRLDGARRLVEAVGAALKPGGGLFVAAESGATLARMMVTAGRVVGSPLDREDRDSAMALRGSASAGGLRPLRMSPGEIRAALDAAGFSQTRLYAPIPDPVGPKAVLPLDHRGAIAYFLTHLVRRTSTVTRGAIAGAKLLLELGLFPSAVPFVYATATRREKAASDGKA